VGGSSFAGGGGGHFASQKKRAVRSMKVNMAEGPSTIITPSNQFIVKCSVCSHHVYKHIGSPCIGELFETFCEEDNKHDKYAVAVHLNNYVGHIMREVTCIYHFFIKKRKTTVLHSSLWRCRSTMASC